MVPDFQSIMLPFLQMAGDNQEHSISEMMEYLADHFDLSQQDLDERIPSGRQTRFYNRVTWSGTHLKQAGLIDNVRRGYFKISDLGKELLNKNLPKIDLNVLAQYPGYIDFRNRGRMKLENNNSNEVPPTDETPDELLDDAYRAIRESLANELLEKIKSCSPSFFESLVVHLLVKMGYGGTLKDAGQAIGKSGDGGIDGIIKEDRLGLDVIYLQAKRWEGNVSRPEIQKFAGALLGNQARKGVFITTSGFTKEAREYVKTISSTIILIDGIDLAELMIDYSVGVSVAASYEIKKVDSDFFTES